MKTFRFKNKSINDLSSSNISYAREHLGEPEYLLFILASTLIIIGIVFSYSLSIYTVKYQEYNDLHFFMRQLLSGVASIAIMYWFLGANPHQVIPKLSWWFLGIFFVLIVIMPVLPSFLVTESGGAKRWIRLPLVSISPTEFFKIGFIYLFAWSFNRKIVGRSNAMKLAEEIMMLIPYFLIFLLLAIFIVIFQKDLGQFVVLALIFISFIYLADRSKKLLYSMFFTGIGLFVAAILIAGHRTKRIGEWWAMHQENLLAVFPESLQNELMVSGYDEPYQVGHSLNAFSNGGIFGEGIGNGFLKMGFLSEVHTDFVLAGISEEIGIVGIVFIVFLLFVLSMNILKIANRVDTVYSFFCVGVFVMIMGAFFINIFGVTGSIPIKGIAVPFLSYGGSSVISTSIAIGMVISISRLAKR